MTEQTEGAEALRRVLVDQHTECGRVFVGIALARAVLASDWLAAREAAAEVRGAQAVLAAVAEDWPEDGMTRAEAQHFLAARAAAAAAGGGGEA